MNEQDVLWCDTITVLGNQANRNLTFELAELAIEDRIPGAMAECGVMSGGHPAIMARAILKHSAGRLVHLYDSFERFPQPGPDDVEDYKKVYGVNSDREHGKPMAVWTGSLDQVKHNMEVWKIPDSMLVYHVGWIQELLAKEAIPSLALLRVDVDLYDSTAPIFKYLYPRMPRGGIVISDDWGESPSAPCRVATIKTIGCTPLVFHVIGQETTVWWRKP